MSANLPPTQAAVARLAGVSTATVSLALNAHPRISAATKRRVHEAAKRLGYRLDPRVHELMAFVRTRRKAAFAGVIGYVMHEAHAERKTLEASSRQYLAGLQRRARELGYGIDVFRLREKGTSDARLSRILVNRGIRGLCIGPMPRSCGKIEFEWDRFAAVGLGFGLLEPDMHRVAKHHYNNALLALQSVAARGFRRIGLVLIENKDQRWKLINRSAVFTFQVDVPERERVPVFDGPLGDLVGWFEAHRPDAVVGFGARPLSLLAQGGYRAPHDFGYADMDADLAAGRCAGLDQRSELVGETALNQVVGLLHRHEFGVPENPHVVLINGRWIDGPTLQPAGERVTKRTTRPAPAR